MSDTLSVLMFLAGWEMIVTAGVAAAAVVETPVEREELSSSDTLNCAGQTAT